VADQSQQHPPASDNHAMLAAPCLGVTGGFDLHDNLIRDHGGLLGKVSDAMTAFYNATVEMGVAGQETAFTASDFGHTPASNGDGSDQGWGSHQLWWAVPGSFAAQHLGGPIRRYLSNLVS
jgi:uncharacterized protein (DUF1501 family)